VVAATQRVIAEHDAALATRLGTDIDALEAYERRRRGSSGGTVMAVIGVTVLLAFAIAAASDGPLRPEAIGTHVVDQSFVHVATRTAGHHVVPI
jgi:hypothetical protein